MNYAVSGEKLKELVKAVESATGTVPSPSLTAQISRSVLLPGFADVHVHFREPGFSYKETIRTGSLAALCGGYTDVCTMPNLYPVPDSLAHLKAQLDIIEKDAVIGVHPFAAITVGEKGEELSDMEALAPYVVGFSDDGRGVQSRDMMLCAMRRAKALGKPIAAHCEDNSLLCGGYIHAGEYASKHGHRGISSESEWRQIERDIALVRETGCAYHVCHISTAKSVALIRAAKAEGLDISCETAPHYLLLDDSMLSEDGRFKMNPPLRGRADREALIEGVLDGTVDMIATDHAPHSNDEKARGLAGSPMGVSGLECAFSALYTGLVKSGIITLQKLAEIMSENPRRRFKLPSRDFCLWDLSAEYRIDAAAFKSKGHSTPFDGRTVFGKHILSLINGKAVLNTTEGYENV